MISDLYSVCALNQTCDVHIKREDFTGKVFFFLFHVLELFLSFKIDISFIKIDQYIPILRLKKIKNSYCSFYHYYY